MPMIINPFYIEIFQTTFCSVTVFFTSLANKKHIPLVTAEILENKSENRSGNKSCIVLLDQSGSQQEINGTQNR